MGKTRADLVRRAIYRGLSRHARHDTVNSDLTKGRASAHNQKETAMHINRGSQGFRLLTPGNPKTEKGKGAGYWTFILHFAPARLSGYQVCPMATAGCEKACLNTAGRGGIAVGGTLTHADVASGKRSNAIQKARHMRTVAYFEHRAEFMALLAKEIAKACKLARSQGYTPVFRLNGTSDIRWESVPVGGFPNIMCMFSDVQFYDYTKLPNRKKLPANYHLTFSLADGNDAAAYHALNAGMNVAAVFRDKATVQRYVESGFALTGLPTPVSRGDDTDLRFLDPAGHVIALYAKGNARRDQSGFVRD